MTSATASGRRLTLAALALLIGLAFAIPAQQEKAIAPTLGALQITANLDKPAMHAPRPGVVVLEGRLAEAELVINISSVQLWELTIEANGRTLRIHGVPGEHEGVYLGDVQRLRLKPGDSVRITLAVRALV